MKPDTQHGLEAMQSIRMIVLEMHSAYNDGWTASHHKRDLFIIKHLLEEIYNNAPVFTNEKDWEHELLIEKLKND